MTRGGRGKVATIHMEEERAFGNFGAKLGGKEAWLAAHLYTRGCV